jgi:hypothetical protein
VRYGVDTEVVWAVRRTERKKRGAESESELEWRNDRDGCG